MCIISTASLFTLKLIILFQIFQNKQHWMGYVILWSFFSISWSFHCEISELMIDTQGSEWSKDGEMKIDKCVWAEEAALIALYRENTDCSSVCSLLEKELFMQTPSLQQQHCHFKQTGTGTLQIYLEQRSFSQAETWFQLKPVQNHSRVPLVLLVHWTSAKWTVLLLK